VYISTFSTGTKLDKFDMPEVENPPHRVSKESLINFKKGRIMHKFRILCVFFYSRAITAPIYINKYYFYFRWCFKKYAEIK
jgi:hypothetical protein